jgi:hypothetical protein
MWLWSGGGIPPAPWAWGPVPYAYATPPDVLRYIETEDGEKQAAREEMGAALLKATTAWLREYELVFGMVSHILELSAKRDQWASVAALAIEEAGREKAKCKAAERVAAARQEALEIEMEGRRGDWRRSLAKLAEREAAEGKKDARAVGNLQLLNERVQAARQAIEQAQRDYSGAATAPDAVVNEGTVRRLSDSLERLRTRFGELFEDRDKAMWREQEAKKNAALGLEVIAARDATVRSLTVQLAEVRRQLAAEEREGRAREVAQYGSDLAALGACKHSGAPVPCGLTNNVVCTCGFYGVTVNGRMPAHRPHNPQDTPWPHGW